MLGAILDTTDWQRLLMNGYGGAEQSVRDVLS